MKVNYQLKLDKMLEQIKNLDKKPTLLLHACCAPCSSYVLTLLASFFDITLYYYNPNIYPYLEFQKRVSEVEKLIKDMNLNVKLIVPNYNNQEFMDTIKGLEKEVEGGKRCFKCYRLRLEHACKYAKIHNFDYFTTTLSISPYKNSDKLNEIGYELEDIYQIPYLCADFKKKDGYKKSIELSKKYNLYRQNYCGCIYSKRSEL